MQLASTSLLPAHHCHNRNMTEIMQICQSPVAYKNYIHKAYIILPLGAICVKEAYTTCPDQAAI